MITYNLFYESIKNCVYDYFVGNIYIYKHIILFPPLPYIYSIFLFHIR